MTAPDDDNILIKFCVHVMTSTNEIVLFRHVSLTSLNIFADEHQITCE